MRIVIIGPIYPFRGGIAHYSANLAQALQNAEHEILFISFSRLFPKILYPGKSTIDSSQNCLRITANYLIDTLRPTSWFVATKEIIQFKPDIVIFQWWTTFLSFVYSCISKKIDSLGIKVVFLVHNVIPHENNWFDRFLVRIAFNYCQSFIVQSENQFELLKVFSPNSKIYYCEHPVYEMFANHDISKKDACNELNVNSEIPVLLFFGIVRPYKGIELLLEVLSELKNRGYQFILIIAGEFWISEKTIIKKIKKLGLSDQIRIINRYIKDEEIPTLFAAADIFVAPYVNGTQSGAVKMAFSFGIPSIITSVIADNFSKKIKNVEIVEPEFNSLLSGIRKYLDSYPIDKTITYDNNGWKDLVATIEKIQ